MTESEYHFKRKMFVIKDGRAVFSEKNGSHKDWLGNRYVNYIRGYIFPGRVQFYTGEMFDKADIDSIPLGTIRDIMRVYRETYGMTSGTVYNGCVAGEPGKIWDGMETCFTFCI